MDAQINSPYSDYDAFAKAYNAHWGPDYGEKAIPYLRRLLLDELKPHATILDLCCGSGHVTQALISEGYQLTGLDGSQQLPSYAKANAPQASFIWADARSFTLPGSYDAMICLNDSLNHVSQLEELKTVFQNVFAVVRRHGSFVFDLNLAHK